MKGNVLLAVMAIGGWEADLYLTITSYHLFAEMTPLAHRNSQDLLFTGISSLYRCVISTVPRVMGPRP